MGILHRRSFWPFNAKLAPALPLTYTRALREFPFPFSSAAKTGSKTFGWELVSRSKISLFNPFSSFLVRISTPDSLHKTNAIAIMQPLWVLEFANPFWSQHKDTIHSLEKSHKKFKQGKIPACSFKRGWRQDTHLWPADPNLLRKQWIWKTRTRENPEKAGYGRQ